MNANYKIHGSVDTEFTKVPKALILNTSLSGEARVLFSFLIDLTGDFSVNERGLSTLLGFSEFKVRNAVIQLEAAGYIRRTRIMNKNKFAGWFWDISVIPTDSNNSLVKNSSAKNSLVKNSSVKNSSAKDSRANLSSVTDSKYIKDRKDTKPINDKLNIKETNLTQTEESVFTPTLTPLNQLGEDVISSENVNTIQAFNRFCEVYPNLGDRNTARAAFLAIPDISRICWQIANSVEWFEKSKRWDDWQTGQKNVACPQAAKFLKRGDWQQYLSSGATMTRRERMNAILPDEENDYEVN